MKKTAVFLLIAALYGYSYVRGEEGAGSVASSSRPLTLPDCYALALKQSETIAINAELIKEAEAHFLQAFGLLMPHVSLVDTEHWHDKSGVSATSRYHTTERRFAFSQTLFSGFREFAGISGSNFERSQRSNEKRRAEQLLFTDVADAFYLLLEEGEDLNTLVTIRDALASRIEELRQREKLGRSRRSEVVNTEAQYYIVQAEIESVKSQEILARQLLEFLTGRPIGKIVDPENTMPLAGSEDTYVIKADSRPDVQAARDAWELAKRGVTVARSAFFPTVTVTPNYYEHRTTSPVKDRWDAQLQVELPIFEGTETFGALKLARAQARESELSYQRVRRLAVQDIRDVYTTFRTSFLQADAFEKALRAAELNYDLQKKDYQLNLVNNLDVLQAIQSLEETRRNHTHILYETKRAYWQLRVALGDLTLERLYDSL